MSTTDAAPKRDNGGPAFPLGEQRDSLGNGISEVSFGMSLRDWFAGQALPAIMVSAGIGRAMRTLSIENIPPSTEMAAMSYELADAMLKARGNV